MFVLDSIKNYENRLAFVGREGTMTYAQLNSRSEAFAAWLLEELGEDRTPVVLYGHKEADMLCCIFGVLKSGRAYVPVDSTTPCSRAEEILSAVKPRIVANFSGQQLRTNATVLMPEQLESILARPGAVAQSNWVSGDDTAYILFTSGSTGKPKGVTITAANLAAFNAGLRPFWGDGGVVLNQPSYAFDLSGCALYAGIGAGMTLFTVDGALLGDTGAFFEALGKSELTTWVSTPSLAELCVRSPAFCEALLPQLERFLFCGEVLTNKLCDQLAERFPGCEILNTYGPTEATVLVTAVSVTKEMRADPRPVPIGAPIGNVRLRLVDEDGAEITNEDTEGELLILGDSVGPGYMDPQLTAERFFRDPDTGLWGYHTGDICWRSGGQYYYRCRSDNQLKLSGHRIELEDIEANLTRLENISRAAVVPVWQGQQVKALTAFVQLEQPDGQTALGRSLSLKKQAATLLPAYMIPRRFVVVEQFPTNQNDKIDRKALARMVETVAP